MQIKIYNHDPFKIKVHKKILVKENDGKDDVVSMFTSLIVHDEFNPYSSLNSTTPVWQALSYCFIPIH